MITISIIKVNVYEVATEYCIYNFMLMFIVPILFVFQYCKNFGPTGKILKVKWKGRNHHNYNSLQPQHQTGKECMNIEIKASSEHHIEKPSKQPFPRELVIQINNNVEKTLKMYDRNTNNDDSQQKHRLGTVSNKLLCVCVGGGA